MAFEFNEQQQAVIDFENNGRDAIIVAGPGSGKTATIVERVARKMIQSSEMGREMMMLTFSKKAANEMKGRLINRVWGDTPLFTFWDKMPFIGTYHSFGFWLLQNFPAVLDIRENFTLLDTADQKKKFKEFLNDNEWVKLAMLTTERLGTNGVCMHGLLPINQAELSESILTILGAKLPVLSDTLEASEDFIVHRLTEVIESYASFKRRSNVFDYNDLLSLPAAMLRGEGRDGQAFESMANHLASTFKEIIVDEAQDTNKVQFEIIERMMSIADERGYGSMQTVIMVGDDDQTIYDWRGARLENMYRFAQQTNAVFLYLEKNYRSRPEIVEHAVKLIEHNTQRFDKKPISIRRQGAEVCAYQWRQNSDMGQWMAASIKQSIAQGVPANQIAVITRTNSLLRQVERHLLASSVPYKVHKGMEVLAFKEIQLALSAVRIMFNPYDEAAFEKLMEVVPGVGKVKVKAALSHAAIIRNMGGNREGLRGIMLDYIADHNDAFSEKLRQLSLEIIEVLIDGIKEDVLVQLFNRVSVFRDFLEKEEGSKKDARLFRLDEISRAMYESVKMNGLENAPQEKQWTAAIDILLSGGERMDDGSSVVTLITAHGAKSLEWSKVYVYGFSDGLFPMRRWQQQHEEEDEYSNLESERRLAYVAMTRAKDCLYLLHADDMGMWFDKIMNVSPFVEEAEIPLARKDRTVKVEMPKIKSGLIDNAISF